MRMRLWSGKYARVYYTNEKKKKAVEPCLITIFKVLQRRILVFLFTSRQCVDEQLTLDFESRQFPLQILVLGLEQLTLVVNVPELGLQDPIPDFGRLAIVMCKVTVLGVTVFCLFLMAFFIPRQVPYIMLALAEVQLPQDRHICVVPAIVPLERIRLV